MASNLIEQTTSFMVNLWGEKRHNGTGDTQYESDEG